MHTREKPGRPLEGGDSKGTRLDDRSDCSTEEDPCIYAKWRIFVCRVATSEGGPLKIHLPRTLVNTTLGSGPFGEPWCQKSASLPSASCAPVSYACSVRPSPSSRSVSVTIRLV